MQIWESSLDRIAPGRLAMWSLFFGTPENTPFVIRTDLSFRHGSMKIPKYTKYSEISILCSESKSHAQIIKKVFSVLPVWRFPVCKTKPSA